MSVTPPPPPPVLNFYTILYPFFIITWMLIGFEILNRKQQVVLANSQKLFINTPVTYRKYYHTKLYGNFVILLFLDQQIQTSIEFHISVSETWQMQSKFFYFSTKEECSKSTYSASMEQLSLAMLKAFAKFVSVVSELDTYFRLLASAGIIYS